MMPRVYLNQTVVAMDAREVSSPSVSAPISKAKACLHIFMNSCSGGLLDASLGCADDVIGACRFAPWVNRRSIAAFDEWHRDL